MKNHFLNSTLVLALVAIIFFESCSSPRSVGTVNKDASEWYNAKTWLNGVQLTPHPSINQQEFQKQYTRNNKYWDEAFQFIKNTDLENIKPGVYIVDTGNVTAIISELSPKNKEEVKWEAHRNFNDLQYIIKGKAQMGVAPLSSPNSVSSVAYDSKTDNENFNVSGENYYDAEPGTFFIFSPNEIHRPAFKVDGSDQIKKIVIKVRVPQ